MLDGLDLLGRHRHRPDHVRRRASPGDRLRPRRTATPASCALLEAALARDLPTLAICRGFQLLNVLRGGDLIQHLPEAVGHEGHREVLGDVLGAPRRREGRDEARGDPRAASRARCSRATTRGSGRVGDGLVETAWAEDGSLEGLEDPSKRFAVGVLWHPEMEEDDKRLFEALVAEARRYRAERQP